MIMKKIKILKADFENAKKLFINIEKNQSELISNSKKLESVLEKYYAGGENIHNVERGGNEDKLSRDSAAFAVYTESALSETSGRLKISYYFNELKKALIGALQEDNLTEAMDKRFAKEWEGNCKVLINQLENEQKGKLGAHKGTINKMIDTLKTVKEYPDLMDSLFHSNLVN